LNNIIALILTFALSLIFLRLMNFIAARGWMDSRLSRKVIHIGTGPLFVLCWLMFRDTPDARWLAALVPFAITIQFALTGLGVIKDPASVQAMSRTGDPKEILRGPLYYGIMFVLLTVVFWKDSPVGMVALMMMCGGDGIADVVGRRIPSAKLPWSKDKSFAGTISVFFGGLILSAFILAVYVAAGVFPGPFSKYILPIIVIAFVSMLVESLPHKDVDNITMTLAAVMAGWLVF
jgi:phytol kinase